MEPWDWEGPLVLDDGRSHMLGWWLVVEHSPKKRTTRHVLSWDTHMKKQREVAVAVRAGRLRFHCWVVMFNLYTPDPSRARLPRRKHPIHTDHDQMEIYEKVHLERAALSNIHEIS